MPIIFCINTPRPNSSFNILGNLVESTKNYPVSFNGKMKFTLELPLDLSKDEIQQEVMNHPKTIQFIEGKTPKTIIIVPGKIVNIVV